MKKAFGKKGIAALDQLGGLVTMLGYLVILFAVIFLIVAEIKSNAAVVADANATTAVTATQNAMSDIPGWLPIIVITVIGGVLLVLIGMFRWG